MTTDSPSALAWLQQWYAEQCDGDWEHQFGIEIKSLDNPGWRMMIDLTRTSFENIHFEEVHVERSDDDWVRCWIKTKQFHAAGGPANLEEAITIFRQLTRSQD